MHAALETLRDYIRRHGLKQTQQRENILLHVLAAGRHMSPEQIFLEMRRKDPRLGRATVFRTLKLLETCGLVSHVTDARGAQRYEPAHGRRHHDHMICMQCGETLEFESEAIEKLQAGLARARGFSVLWHRHELFGRCRRCAAGEGRAGSGGARNGAAGRARAEARP
jgi:Fur family ferric uptake transcriptional regulator